MRMLWIAAVPVVLALAAVALWPARPVGTPGPPEADDLSASASSAAARGAGSSEIPAPAAPQPSGTASADAAGASDPAAARLDTRQCLEAVEAARPELANETAEALEDVLDVLMRGDVLQTAHRDLALASDPELRLAAAILAPLVATDEAGQLALLTPDSGNVLVAWHGLRLCIEMQAGTCPLEGAFADELARLGGSNSEIWAQIAASRYRRGDEAAALDALRRAAAATESSAFWLETVELMDRALRVSAGLDANARIALALGGYDSPRYGLVELMCRERASPGNEWSRSCLALSELMEREYRTQIGRSGGRSLRMAVLRAEGVPEDEIAARLSAQRSEPPRGPVSLRVLAEAMMRSGDSQFYRYLDLARQYGETTGALRYAEQEAPAFLAMLGLGNCAPVLLGEAAP